jgi:sugar/nucleoside kinase (ribokinase family)
MKKIVVLGSTNTDMVVTGKKIPVPGETVSGGHFLMNPGRKVKAVDCVAAGDTFNGAFAVALAEGKSCADAIAFAQKASAISVTRPGAQSSVPFRKEIK